MENKWKKWLIVFGIFILVGITVITGYVIYQYLKIQPNNVHFSNITSNSVTVSWNTEKPGVSAVVVKEGKGLPLALGVEKQKHYDSRDVTKAKLMYGSRTGEELREDYDIEEILIDMGEYYTHHVEVTGLEPETEYAFFVGEGFVFNKVEDIDGVVSVKTLETPESIKPPIPAYGTVKDADGVAGVGDIKELDPVTDGVIYLNYLDTDTEKRSNTFSSTFNSEGNWYMDLSTAVDDEGKPFLETYDTVEGNIIVELLIDAGSKGVWQKREAAYWLKPASSTVLNMPDGVKDINILGSVVRVDEVGRVLSETDQVGAVLSADTCCESGFVFVDTDNCVPSTQVPNVCGEDPDECMPDPSCSTGLCCGDVVCEEGNEYCINMNSDGEIRCISDTTYTPAEPCNLGQIPEELQGRKCCGEAICPSDTEYESCGTDNEDDNYCVEGSEGTGEIVPGLCTAYAGQEDTLVDPTCDKLITTCGDCYRLAGTWDDGSVRYQRCDQKYCDKPIECSKIPPTPEVAQQEGVGTCAGGGQYLKSCTIVGGQCRQCGWGVVNSNDQYGVRWTDTEGDLCDTGWQEMSVHDCNVSEGETCTCPPDVYEGAEICVFDEYNRCVPVKAGVSCDCDGGNCVYNEDGDCKKVGSECYTSDGLAGTIQEEDGECGGLEERAVGDCQGKNKGEPCSYDSNDSGENDQLVCAPDGQICVEVGEVCGQSSNNRYVHYGSHGSCNVIGDCIEGFQENEDETCLPEGANAEEIASFLERYCKNKAKRLVIFPTYASDGVNAHVCIDGLWVAPEVGAYQFQADTCTAFVKDNEKNTCLGGTFTGWGYPVCINANDMSSAMCVEGTWQNSISVSFSAESNTETPAYTTNEIEAGEQCNPPSDDPALAYHCECLSGPDKGDIILKTRWCREVETITGLDLKRYCIGEDKEDKVCKRNGDTCNENDTDVVDGEVFLRCNGPSPSASTNKYDNELISLNNLSSKVLGQTAGDTQYIVDPETGMFLNIPEGIYVFEYQGETLSFVVMSPLGQALVYIDENENGEYDEGIDTLISDIASEINIIPIEQVFNYSLREGLNFISFPFLISAEDSQTAAGLLQRLNRIYEDKIYSISKYENGGWKIVGQNVELYDARDFNLIPGEGYVIKAQENVDISIVGQPVRFESATDSAPINFTPGWNLVGVYGTNVKDYTASTLLEDINSKDFVTYSANRWERDKQLYEGFKISGGENLGIDFPVKKSESIFIKIQQGSGLWNPELGD